MRRLKESLHASERARADLEQQLEAAKQKAATDSLRDAEQRISEETRLKDSLAESTQTVAALKRELDAAKSQSEQLGAAEQRWKQDLATSEQTIAALKKEVEASAAMHAGATSQEAQRMKESLAASEQVIATLKQDLGSVSERIANDHQQRIAQKDTLIDELKQKVQAFADREKKFLTSPPALPGGLEQIQSAATGGGRKFSMLAMGIVAALFAGTGGIGGYLAQKDPSKSAPFQALQTKLSDAEADNGELQGKLRSLRADYLKLEQDSKVAQGANAASNQGSASNTDVQRQLDAALETSRNYQKKLSETEAALEQRNQQTATQNEKIAAQDQQIAHLNQELQDLKSQYAKPEDSKAQVQKPQEKEPAPRPRRASDFESTIRNLEREYGREFGIPRLAR